MESETPRQYWTVGIHDDVTFTSLPVKNYGFRTAGTKTRQVINWGFGGDGSVGAMGSTARLVSEKTPNYVQLYHTYDSKKEGGATISHLRIGPDSIGSHYLITENADYVQCTKTSFVKMFDMTTALK